MTATRAGDGADASRARSAIFVLPSTTVGQMGPVASWISTAGWAAAARRALGGAWIATQQGVLEVEEVRRRATVTGPPRRAPRARRAVPLVVKTAAKDLREAWRARAFHVSANGPWSGEDVAFVWQRHELFHRAGLDLARVLDVPSVVFVPALLVEQASGWGVRRPGWGRWIERSVEAKALGEATVVACGSEVVAEQARSLGVSASRLLVTPTGVDLDLFAARHDPTPVRWDLGLDGGLVVGWVGSFRGFHQVGDLIRAADGLTGVTLLMVGDGPERAGAESLAATLGVRTIFTGLVSHDELPRLLQSMDVAVVMAQPGVPFHYSPLKVAEYLAAGLPIVAPNVDSVFDRLDTAGCALLYDPGDPQGLTAALIALRDDLPARARLAAAARTEAARWSWDHQLERVLEALGAEVRPDRH